jgi:hypothetical protein
MDDARFGGDDWDMSKRIERLREAVERAHDCKARYVCSTEVCEVFGGEIIWDGVVKTFDIEGHPKAKRCYAFPFIDDDESDPSGGRIVLNLPPVDSPETAVKVAIARKSRNEK